MHMPSTAGCAMIFVHGAGDAGNSQWCEMTLKGGGGGGGGKLCSAWVQHAWLKGKHVQHIAMHMRHAARCSRCLRHAAPCCVVQRHACHADAASRSMARHDAAWRGMAQPRTAWRSMAHVHGNTLDVLSVARCGAWRKGSRWHAHIGGEKAVSRHGMAPERFARQCMAHVGSTCAMQAPCKRHASAMRTHVRGREHNACRKRSTCAMHKTYVRNMLGLIMTKFVTEAQRRWNEHMANCVKL